MTGKPYAIDTKRHWFKLIDENSQVDWKLIYSSDEESVTLVDNMQKRVTIEGLTLSLEGAPRGVEKFVKILK